tara:strand:- start:969 stop:2423 length:1455 start_codon:yes stop_codon:yes gene_type:complete
MKDFEFKQIKTTNNNIPLIINKNDSGLVFILVLFNVGAVNENKDNSGISHFLEHVLFGQTKDYNGDNTPIKFMGNNAIDFNAFTSKENTGFYLHSNKDNIKDILDVIYQMIVYPRFDNDEIEKERKIVFEEKANMKDDPHDLASERYYQILFPDDNLSKSIIGTDKTLNNIDRNKLIDYFDKFYKNSKNISICLSGDIDDNIIKLVIDKFINFDNEVINYKKKYLKYKIKYHKIKQSGGALSTIIPLSIGAYLFKDILTNNNNEVVVFKDIKLPYHDNILKEKFEKTTIILNYKCDINDEYTLDLISNLLTYSLHSILSYKLREQLNLIYGIRSSCSIYINKGYFSIYTNTEKIDSLKLIIDTIIDSLNDLKDFKINDLKTNEKKDISQQKINSSKLLIENNLLKLQLSHSSLGSYMIRQFYLYRNRLKSKNVSKFPEELQIRNVINKFKTITKQDIIDVSKRTFIPENLCLSTVCSKNFKYKF